MILRPQGIRGAAFTLAAAGDQRAASASRASVAAELGIDPHWATLHQVHGSTVIEATHAGELGEGDALFTRVPRLPLAVFTADCLAVVLEGDGIVGIAHAGWRGLAAGVIAGLRTALEDAGSPAKAAAIGPAIGSCCFEVGEDVAGRFPEEAATTTWGSPSVDLLAAARAQLAGLGVWDAGRCTGHDPGLFSHRRQGTDRRMAAIGWLA
jgi:YfiH family protein